MAAELIVRKADGSTQVIPLEAERYSVGRAASNDFSHPEEDALSRQHLTLERRDGGWVVADLGSRNGTQVNGVRIDKPTPLRSGDRITAGRLSLLFSSGGPVPDRPVFFVDDGTGVLASTVAIKLDSLLGGPDAAHDKGKPAPLASAQQTRALIHAGTELASRRSLDELLPLILDLAVNAVGASRGVLMLREGGALVTRAVKGSSLQISSTARDRVLLNKESLLIQDVQLDEKLRAQASIMSQSVRSIIAAPLQAKGEVIGLIYLDSSHFIRAFTREDLNLITVMANIAAIRIEIARLTEVEEHERLMAKEMAQAAEIQRSLLPRSVPALAGLEVAAVSETCLNAGGDHYDFYERPGGKLVLLVGDVAGKGMPAALLMASLQARVQVLMEVEADLATLVTRLNRVTAANCPGNRFVTFFICEIELATGEMTFVNAGHNPPLLIRKDGRVARLEGGGIILGILGRATYTQQACRMEEGDLLVMFSDGVTEAERPGTEEDFGEARLLEALSPVGERSAAGMIERVKAAVTAFAGSVSAKDDFTLVLARKTACS